MRFVDPQGATRAGFQYLLNRRIRWRRALIAVLPLAAVLAWQVALAQASPSSASASRAAADAAPSPCLLNSLLCGGGLINPTCTPGTGSCQPAEVPSPPGGPGVPCGTSPLPACPQQAPGSNTRRPGSGGSGSTGSAGAGTGNALAFAAPPGVGLVQPAPGVAPVSAPEPDPLALLLSLSIRDGLSAIANSIWPLLAAVQVLVLLALVTAACSRQLTAASEAREGRLE